MRWGLRPALRDIAPYGRNVVYPQNVVRNSDLPPEEFRARPRRLIAPNYDVAKRKENLWYLTYLYYNLLRFAAKGMR